VSFGAKVGGACSVARKCLKHKEAFWNDVCINRAYYSVYYIALEVLARLGTYVEVVSRVLRKKTKDFKQLKLLQDELKRLKAEKHRVPGHEAVRIVLGQMEGEKHRSLSKALLRLWRKRVKADYRPEFCSEREAKECVRLCIEEVGRWRKSLNIS